MEGGSSEGCILGYFLYLSQANLTFTNEWFLIEMILYNIFPAKIDSFA